MAAPVDLSNAPSLEQQAYLCGLELQAKELALPEENRPNNTTISFDTEENTVTIEITLNTTTSVVGNDAVISASAYLA